ncbi:MAG: TonB-dependent receptor [Bacteroidetes bacterium]|nr:TonB-dependent receptor [Bacteroidota bacterium]
MNKFFLYISIFFISTLAIHAQSDTCKNSLYGKIIDEHDRKPLEFASVYIVELAKGAVSDNKGRYKIEDICNGIYTVKISHIGCESLQSKIIVKGKTNQNFYPEHHAEILKDIEITAQKLVEQTTQTKNDVSEEKLNQSKGQSLGESLKSITGVNSLNTGNSISKPIIHGMHSNRILILNNGVRQEGQQWGVEHAPEIDPFTANKLSVIKGANSVRYGSDAIAGVVIVESKPLRDSAGINGEVNLVGMTNGKAGTASAYLEGNFNRLKAFSWRVQGTLKQTGTVSAPNYILVNTGLRESNFSYTLGWKKKKYGAEIFYSQFNTTLGIFGASHIGNITDLNTAFKSPVPLETGPFTYKIGRPYQNIEHELFKAKMYIVTGVKGKLSVTYARQYNLRNEYDKHKPLNDSLAALNKPELQFELTTHSADIIWEHNQVKHFTGSIGFSGLTQGNTYEGRALIPNFRNYNGGIFWIERWRRNKFELEAGIRYDYKRLQVYKYQYVSYATYQLVTPVHTFENVSGNVGAIYKPGSNINLAFNLGTAWRAPSVSELYSYGLHHGAAAIEYGDNTLKSERTYNGIFTLRYTPSKRITIEVSPYLHYVNNFIYRQPATVPVVTIRGAFPAFYYKQTDATLKGCDFYLNYKFTNSIELTGKASILRAWNNTENNWLIMMPSDRYESEITYRFKNYKKLNSSYLSASVLYVTKQWRVPANSDFVAPPSEYYTFNIHGSCSIKIKNQNIELGVSVFNLLNKTYRDYLDRFRYFTDAMGRNITFRIKVPFNINLKSK